MRKAPAVVGNFRVPRLRGLLGVLVLCLITSAMMSPAAHAAGSSIAIAANGPNPQPSGAPSSYTINFTCSSLVSQTCGTNPTITIPLDLTSGIPGTPDMSTWVYNSASSPAGLIQSASVQGENYVITLDPTQLQPGDSDEITLNVTPAQQHHPGCHHVVADALLCLRRDPGGQRSGPGPRIVDRERSALGVQEHE